MRKKCYGIIPVRYASTRLPGKPLMDICGKPMFWHVYDRASQCQELDEVWLATDDERIALAAKELNVPCIMTRADHPCGTDRIHEAATLLKLPADSIIVNIQGDEPLLEPAMLGELIAPFFEDSSVAATTMAMQLDPANEKDAALVLSPNQVKVVCALNGDALYFSRAPLPFARDEQPCEYQGHIGIYAFRRDILARFTSLPQSPLEKLEKLEQLRLLENNIPLRVVITKHRPHGVDTPEDMEAVRSIMAAMH